MGWWYHQDIWQTTSRDIPMKSYEFTRPYSQNPIRVGDTVEYHGQRYVVRTVEGSKLLLSLGPDSEDIVVNSVEVKKVNGNKKIIPESITRANKKINNLVVNQFPMLPDSRIFFEREKYSSEWLQFKKTLIEYQLRYDDGTVDGKLKMRSVSKLISESYHGIEVRGLNTIKDLLATQFKHCVKPQQLQIGSKYDVAVVRLDKLSKVIEVDAHYDQTVKSVEFFDSQNDYVVSTVEGLMGTTDISNLVEEIEVLCFDPGGTLDGILTYLSLKIPPEIEGWRLSVYSELDLDNLVKYTAEQTVENTMEKI
jgi:hypothetical protein